MIGSVVLCADVSPNIIDGSSIWLTSMAEALTGEFSAVHVLLKMRARTDVLVGRLRSLPGVAVHEPVGDATLNVTEAALAIRRLREDVGARACVVRGFEACHACATDPEVLPHLYSYVTDLPFPVSKLSVAGLNRLQRVAHRSKAMFAQTEAARSYLEALAPHAAGKTFLLPPMVPDSAFGFGRQRAGLLRTSDRSVQAPSDARPLKLVYAGKFARDWNTLEMLDLPGAFRSIGVPAELVMIGDKFQKDQNDPTWHLRMKEALAAENSNQESGVTWLGGLPRSEVFEHVARADLGLSWRTKALDSSLELSTKALEYSACGVPPVLNRTADHEALFGESYPFLVDGAWGASALVEHVKQAVPHMKDAADVARTVAADFSISAAKNRIGCAFRDSTAGLSDLGLSGSRPNHAQAPTRLAIVSHDFKFLGELMGHLDGRTSFTVKTDAWESLHRHDPDKSLDTAQWADVIFCEWAGPSVNWMADNKPEDTRLVTRLHGFELRGPWMKELRHEAVDQFIFVSDHHRDKAVEQLGLAPEKTIVIPNGLDTADLNRPKRGGSQFHIGMAGYVSFNKRPDRALRILEGLLEVDERYHLHLLGRSPWEYPHVWNDPLQRAFYSELYAEVGARPDLREHVIFEPFRPDIASWLRSIGVVFSTSDEESFHLAPAEGMASGCLPVVWDRVGAAEIFGADLVVGSIEEARDRILALRNEKDFLQVGKRMKERAAKWDFETLAPQWEQVLSSSSPLMRMRA